MYIYYYSLDINIKLMDGATLFGSAIVKTLPFDFLTKAPNPAKILFKLVAASSLNFKSRIKSGDHNKW